MDLPIGEGPELAGGNVERKRAEMGAFYFLDEETHLLEHAADLAIAAFDEHDFVPGVGGLFDEANPCGCGLHSPAVIKGDREARAQALDGLLAVANAPP